MNIWQLGSFSYFRPSSEAERNIAKKYLWQVSSYPSYSDLGDKDRWESFIKAISEKDINCVKQNKASLIIDDLQTIGLLNRDNYNNYSRAVNYILKMRGVKKWFLVRKLLIKLKDRWKIKINNIELMKQKAKRDHNYEEYLKLKGYKECLIDCRQQIRALCNIPRELDNLDLPNGFEWTRPKKNYFKRIK